MPYEGQTGTAPDGTRVVFRGGKAVPIEAVENPFAYAPKTAKYAEAMAAQRAKMDVAKMDGATEAAGQAGMINANADQIQQLLRRTGTGPLALIAKPFNSDLQSIDRLGQAGIFGDLGKLKGPMSDKDIAFLRSQQVSTQSPGQENQRVVDLARWSARRAQEYESGLNAWTNRLGSPSARNDRGQSYDGWWSTWSQQNLPRPDLTVKRPLPPAARAAQPRPATSPAPAVTRELTYNPKTGRLE